MQRVMAGPRDSRPMSRTHYPLFQSPAEERVNALTHGAAALASAAASAWLVGTAFRSGDFLMFLACAAYAISLTAVFSMSALSHLIETPRLRLLFRALDQASIFLLTAGSFTPLFVRFLIADGTVWLLPVLWGTALLCAWDKLRGNRVNTVSIVPYVALGWLPIFAAKPLLTAMPSGCLLLAAVAAACYMVGILFLIGDRRYRYFHAVWHVLVMAASASTFAGIAVYLV